MNGNPDGFGSLDEAADAVAAYSPARPRPSNPAGLMRNLRLRDNGRLYWHWDPRVIQPVDYEDLHPMTEQALAMAPNITVPTLLVRGGLSDVVDHAGVEDMRALIPQTEVCDVPGAGHMVAGDDNSTFHAGIALFLEQHLPLNQTVR
jgi:pimeloyl-ACP methyl ester carboxylesterase